jgi:class 3 adenylate cyclase
MSAEVHERVAERYPGAVLRTLTVRGKNAPVPAYSIAVGSRAPVLRPDGPG